MQSSLPLIELTNFCNRKGYDLLPVVEGKKVRCALFFNDKFIKEGDKLFDNWEDCQRESYDKLYKVL